jgi:hypothetical protein
MIVALALTVAAASPAAAAMLDKAGRFGGLQIAYKVLLPPGYDPAKSYPAVLVFTGGPQELRMAHNTIEADWRPEADKRGSIVISPAAPPAGLFFQGGDRAFPEFLDAIRRDYRISRLHVAGHSNGGLSAFHIAARYPAYFATVTGYPGLADGPDAARLPGLKGKCLFMHVGDRDDGWLGAMRDQADSLRRQGYRIRFTVEKNQVHRLKAAEIDLPRRLFDEIESCGAAPVSR